MNVPDSFARYPQLAIYFAKFRLRKYPYDVLRNDLNWPEPYVVLNTIMKRLRSHRFLHGNAKAATIPEEIRKVIAPGLEIPNDRKDEVLEMPYSARKVSAYVPPVIEVLRGPDTRDDVAKFFQRLVSEEHSVLYPEGATIRLVADYPTRTEADLKVLTQYLRKLWYIEKILALHKKLPEAVSDQDRNFPSSKIWSTLEELQAYSIYLPGQDGLMTRVANIMKMFPEQVRELEQHRKDCRTYIYSQIRAWLPQAKYKIYRGTRALDDDSIKVSLNFTEYPFLKSAFIFLRAVPPRSGDPTEADKVLVTFECRHTAGDSSGRHEERDVKAE